MRFERISVSKYEVYPSRMSQILSRFGQEYEREQESVNLKALMTRSSLAAALFQSEGQSFEPKVSAENCPFYKLVLTGSLFVGFTNPTDTGRLNQTLCGYIVTKEDTISDMSPLSGRRGDNYESRSQCWKITVELARLVEFMKEIEEVPETPDHIDDEKELLELLKRRDEVRNRNNSRQMVFVVWEDLRSRFPTSSDEERILLLPGTYGELDKDKKALVVKKPEAYDSSRQLDVGGPEYRELIGWVEKHVLNPMLNLVGETNLAIYLGAKSFKLSTEETAENCPEKPHGYFSGSFS